MSFIINLGTRQTSPGAGAALCPSRNVGVAEGGDEFGHREGLHQPSPMNIWHNLMITSWRCGYIMIYIYIHIVDERVCMCIYIYILCMCVYIYIHIHIRYI